MSYYWKRPEHDQDEFGEELTPIPSKLTDIEMETPLSPVEEAAGNAIQEKINDQVFEAVNSEFKKEVLDFELAEEENLNLPPIDAQKLESIAKEVIEELVAKKLPDLAEKIIKEELARLLAETEQEDE